MLLISLRQNQFAPYFIKVILVYGTMFAFKVLHRQQGKQCRRVLVVNCFRDSFVCFSFVVGRFDLVHDVDP